MLKTVLLNSFVEIVIHYHSNFWEKFKKKEKVFSITGKNKG